MGGKKVKKTKKQIEEEKALAEAQRKLEEELEQKRLEEEAERRRVEEEKRRVAEEKRRQEELLRLGEQLPMVTERDVAMIDKRKNAKKSRKKDLDDKYLACDPLPDPENEKDLTTFITLWREQVDGSMEEAVTNCQTAEDVIKAINLLLAEAMAQYDYNKIQWCCDYIEKIREIIIHKYDVISTFTLTHIERYTAYTFEELQIEKEKYPNRKFDKNEKPEMQQVSKQDDVMFGIWANVQAKQLMYDKIKFPPESPIWQLQLPRAHNNIHLVLRCFWTAFDYVSGNENLKKSDYLTVGGVCNCRMFCYPEAPRIIQRWTMRRIQSIEDSLRVIPYPDPQSTVNTDQVPAVYKLPDYVFITENDEVKIGVWDEEQQAWSSDYIDDLVLDKAARQLEFTTRKFAPIAYLQSKVTDFPYDSWYLRCIDNEVGLLSINTKRINVNIEIHPLFVKLVEMDQPEFQHLVNKELHAGILLMELSKCGVHMLPEDSDAARGGIHLKDKAAEERAILDISQTLKTFAFQSIKWNQQASSENILCRLRENPDNDRIFLEDDESDWRSVMWWNNKVSYICAKNCDAQFNGDIAEGQATHSMLSLAVEGVHSEEAVLKCQMYHDIDFIDNVQRTLRLLRLLAFTTNEFDKRTLAEQQK